MRNNMQKILDFLKLRWYIVIFAILLIIDLVLVIRIVYYHDALNTDSLRIKENFSTNVISDDELNINDESLELDLSGE